MAMLKSGNVRCCSTDSGDARLLKACKTSVLSLNAALAHTSRTRSGSSTIAT